MALFLTSKGLLGRAHVAAETNPAVRSSVLLSTGGVLGLAMGKTGKLHSNVPVAAAGAGVGLSLLGLTAVGDGAAAAGATLLGYKMGARSAKPEPELVLRKRVVIRK